VDFGAVIPWKLALLDRAFDRLPHAPSALRDDLERFGDEQARWLDDYALFMAIKAEQGGGSWAAWPEALRMRDPAAMRAARRRLSGAIDRHVFRQFLFFRQWARVRRIVAAAGLRIIGDIPVYVAPDSADVWAHPELFLLDGQRHPSVVAGVPPDFFSETGQLWGNPIYAWERHAATRFAWWIDRLDSLRTLVDLIRIDHFRAFADYWEIPAGSATAQVGRWVDGPGKAFFDHVEAALGEVPIIAEDLGELHDCVPALREAVGLPGMAVLQFGLDGDPDNPFHPDAIAAHTVVYTGTHDNDTTVGWYSSLSRAERRHVDGEIGSTPATVHWDMIETAWRTPAVLAVAPLQDVLGLGTEARMNVPGTTGGNWTWRLPNGALAGATADRLAALNRTTRRHR